MLEFVVANYVVRRLLGVVMAVLIAGQSGIRQIIALLIFGAVALMIMPKTRMYAVVTFLLAVVCYVGVDVLIPNAQLIIEVAGIITGIIALVISKRAINRWLRAHPNNFHTAVRVLLYVV